MTPKSTRSAATPDSDTIRATRLAARLTQAKAAAMCHRSTRAWQDAEAGTRRLDAAAWELFLLRAGRHPRWRLTPR